MAYRQLVQIRCAQKPGPYGAYGIVLYADNPAIPHYAIRSEAIWDERQLFDQFKRYVNEIERMGYEVDIRLPNFYGMFQNLQRYAPPQRPLLSGYWDTIGAFEPDFTPKPLPKPVEADFEVNMVEALIGWRKWKVNTTARRIESQYAHTGFETSLWPVDEPLRAKCTCGPKVPSERHECGIYATDDKTTTKAYEGIEGQVYGWGRYVRGNKGWRSEFAYPKEFYLSEVVPETLDILKQYHVPIYVLQPMRIYDPEEDGYDGHWNAEENRDSRTAEGSSPGEAGSTDED